MRQCQEAVELLLKAALRIVGIEPPKWRDVGPILRGDKFPRWFREHVDRLASISRRLRKERELAMYGDEDSGVPPEELYTAEDAEQYLRDAELAADLVLKLFEEAARR
ncbi:HEPN domain protein [Thermoproteus uzoniensis 768-20]|uniref:HEPN domain protein n=1 Tax=Thermoproteus uzoniensis (strain 768-20) TaxID=999630 RepID=F2L0Q3_THEU7|nr:HEPN domain protein [Thermoproteus uzoniensis 768-20]